MKDLAEIYKLMAFFQLFLMFVLVVETRARFMGRALFYKDFRMVPIPYSRWKDVGPGDFVHKRFLLGNPDLKHEK